MQQRTLGTSQIPITPIIFGGWQAGVDSWPGVVDDESILAHQAAFDAGITTFDTAEWYGNGHSEQVLGKALGSKRDSIQILTKVAPHHLKRDDVLTACDRSLKNLGTDYIDLYQIHWPNDKIPLEETMTALNELKSAGKIKAIGVSNFSTELVKDASKFGRIDSVQPPYNLFWTKSGNDLTPYCVEQKISILAYSPLAQGLLTGRFSKDHVFAEGDVRKKNRLFNGDNFSRALEAIDLLRPIAKKYDATLGDLTLSWLIAQPQTSAIVGARTPAQAVQNAKAASYTLDADDIAKISEIGKHVTAHLDENPVMWVW